MNKKILLSLLIIGVIASVASAGTWAYFSDAAATDNTLTAGELKLDIPTTLTFTAVTGSTDKIVPGDSGTGTVTFKNSGNVNGYLYIRLLKDSSTNYITFTAKGPNEPIEVTAAEKNIYTEICELAPGDSITIPIQYSMATTIKDEAQKTEEKLKVEAVLVQSMNSGNQITPMDLDEDQRT